MCGRNIFDQVFWAEEPADPPAGGVKVFAGGADGEGYACDRGGEGTDSSEGDVVEAVVDLAIANWGQRRNRTRGVGESAKVSITSSERMMTLFFTQRSPIAWSSSLEKTFPIGL